MGAHAHHGDRRRVYAALALTGSFTAVEAIAGVLTGSLALLADAGHMLTDTMALLLAAVAFRIGDKPADRRRSYGYQRFQILAAFANAVALILIVAWIMVEAILRFLAPTPIAAEGMLTVAAAGLVVNIACFALLHAGAQDNLNIQGATIHVLGDLLGSVAAIAAALVILTTGWLPIDPLLSVFVALLILRSAWHLLKRSGHILLEGTPDWIDIDEMCEEIRRKVPQVLGIHHVHVWGLTQENIMLTMHMILDRNRGDNERAVREVKALLSSQFRISHSTIEVEENRCADD